MVNTEGVIEAAETGEDLPDGALAALADAARIHLLPLEKVVSLPGLAEAGPRAVVDAAMESVRRQLL